VVDADKFFSNCYSYSGAVCGAHYLLRQQAYHVMWGGDYVVIDDLLSQELSEAILLGISLYTYRENIEGNAASNYKKNEHYRNNIEYIIKNEGGWKWISVLDKAIKFFDYYHTHSVKYEGFLVNHTKKLAIDLSAYYKRSLSKTKHDDIYLIDLIPALTETGGGLGMALFDGMTSGSTDELCSEWSGDLLQIVDAVPVGYELIDCYFADIWARARFCHTEYGVDEEGFLLEQQGERFIGCHLNLMSKREPDRFIKVNIVDEKVTFIEVPDDPLKR
jgi:hypothetical protein